MVTGHIEDLRHLQPDHMLVDAAFLNNPYPTYQVLRETAPVYWSPEFCGGAWLVSRYEDVALVLQDERFSVQRAGGWVNSSGPEAAQELLAFKRVFARAMLFLNAPRHTRLRQVMNAGFKPGVILALAPQIEKIANTLIDDIEAKLDQHGHFDFIRDFARPLPSRVMAHLMGVPAADCVQFGKWSEDIAAFIGSPTPTMELARPAQTSLLALADYFSKLLPERRNHAHSNPGNDLVSLLLRAEAEGKIKTTKELLAQCAMLLFAGQETTRNLLGNGMATLLQQPQQWQFLQADSTLLPTALRELLRFESPVQYTGRRLVCDVSLHGQTMKKGDLVIALIGAANHDPARFSDPEQLHIERKQGNHLAFGYGPHVCIGASLTMLEGEIAFRCLINRLAGLELLPSALQWCHNAVYRGLDCLQLQRTLSSKSRFNLETRHARTESVLNETSFI